MTIGMGREKVQERMNGLSLDSLVPSSLSVSLSLSHFLPSFFLSFLLFLPSASSDHSSRRRSSCSTVLFFHPAYPVRFLFPHFPFLICFLTFVHHQPLITNRILISDDMSTFRCNHKINSIHDRDTSLARAGAFETNRKQTVK